MMKMSLRTPMIRFRVMTVKYLTRTIIRLCFSSRCRGARLSHWVKRRNMEAMTTTVATGSTAGTAPARNRINCRTQMKTTVSSSQI